MPSETPVVQNAPQVARIGYFMQMLCVVLVSVVFLFIGCKKQEEDMAKITYEKVKGEFTIDKIAHKNSEFWSIDRLLDEFPKVSTTREQRDKLSILLMENRESLNDLKERRKTKHAQILKMFEDQNRLVTDSRLLPLADKSAITCTTSVSTSEGSKYARFDSNEFPELIDLEEQRKEQANKFSDQVLEVIKGSFD